MPSYVLLCLACGCSYPEVVASISEREAMRCTQPGCCGQLSNDYSRQKTSSFQLKGSFPGKDLKIANKLIKDGESM